MKGKLQFECVKTSGSFKCTDHVCCMFLRVKNFEGRLLFLPILLECMHYLFKHSVLIATALCTPVILNGVGRVLNVSKQFVIYVTFSFMISLHKYFIIMIVIP